MSTSVFATSRAIEESPDSSPSPSPIEENLNLPDYAQNDLEDFDLPVLILISHGHAPPLNPPPQLKFDVRNLANPPKHIRDAMNGTSWRLQEWMLSDPKFGERRDDIRQEIKEEMTRMTAENEEEDALKLGQHTERGTDHIRENKDEKNVGSVEDAEEDDGASSEALSSSEETDPDEPSILRVGIFCAMGRHRSVAMVEELAKMSWPGWQVKAQHRDLNKKRGKRSGGKESRGNRGGGIPSHFEED